MYIPVSYTHLGAYLLATFDGNSEEQLEDIIEQASEVVLEAGDVYKRQSMT